MSVRAPVCAVALALAAAVALAGCGLGAGTSAGGATVVVTRDFGTVPVGEVAESKVKGSETVMRLLQRHFEVTTRYGGGFVQSINRLSGSGGPGGVGRPRDWFYYVNGVEADRGAASSKIHDGDRIWWTATTGAPRCASPPWWARSRSRFAAAPAATAAGAARVRRGRGGGVRRGAPPPERRRHRRAARRAGRERWAGHPARARGAVERAALRLRRAPAGARPGAQRRVRAPGAERPHDRRARPGGTHDADPGAGAGLVAATRYLDSAPTWMVTGTDPAGALAAAGALDEGTLGNHFALAVANDQAVAVPAVGR